MLSASRLDGFEYDAANDARPGPTAAPVGRGYAFKYGCIVAGASCRDGTSGTAVCWLDGSRNRSVSCEKKKNVRSFLSGPPTTPPKSFRRCSGFGRWLAFTNQSVASSALFRKYSNTEPRNVLVPDRVTMLICPPGVRPNSGANVDVWIRNSSIASMDTRLFVPPATLSAGSDPPALCAIGR